MTVIFLKNSYRDRLFKKNKIKKAEFLISEYFVSRLLLHSCFLNFGKLVYICILGQW